MSRRIRIVRSFDSKKTLHQNLAVDHENTRANIAHTEKIFKFYVRRGPGLAAEYQVFTRPFGDTVFEAMPAADNQRQFATQLL